ncbi:MAG: NAD(+)/NADH kinase [Thermoproteota archaeon]
MLEKVRIAIVYKTEDAETVSIIDKIKRILKPSFLEEYSISDLKKGLRGFDLVVSIGGDGTLLRTSRAVENGSLILPVNMGKRGYLIEANRDNLESLLEEYGKGNFLVEKCFKLKIEYDDSVLSAVNEVVIRNVRGLKQIELLVELGGGSFIVEGDGFLISTPIGSSAYSLNAGGPFVLSNVGVLICTPLCARRPLRPLIINKDELIRVKYLSGEEAHIIVDGEETLKMDPEKTVRITGSNEIVNIVRFSGSFNIKRMCRLIGGVENE